MTEPAKPELSDDWHLEEPLAYLVKCYNTTISEYQVFSCEIEAQRFAERQEEAANDEGDEEVCDWMVQEFESDITSIRLRHPDMGRSLLDFDP